MNIKRNLLIVSLLVVLVLPTSFAFAAGIEDVKGVNYAHCPEIKLAQASSLSYSGDDLYDSAADLLCAEASAEINSFSANPELSNAQRYTEAKAKRAEIGGSLSDNPELSVAQFTTDVSPSSAEINTFSANPELMVAQRYADAAPVSAEINTLSANPLSFWTPQIYADISFESAETKDCSADCYDNY